MVKEFQLTVETRHEYFDLKIKKYTIKENDRNQYIKKEAITLFHGNKQPHEINIWKNNVSKSKLEISNEVLELQPLINNEYLLTIINYK